jgi:hypothetical protein
MPKGKLNESEENELERIDKTLSVINKFNEKDLDKLVHGTTINLMSIVDSLINESLEMDFLEIESIRDLKDVSTIYTNLLTAYKKNPNTNDKAEVNVTVNNTTNLDELLDLFEKNEAGNKNAKKTNKK